MDLVKLTEEIVKSLVKNPEQVAVKQFDTEEEEYVLIQVVVNDEDMGAVIGREGRIANAIRTIVQASGYVNGQKRIKINVDSF